MRHYGGLFLKENDMRKMSLIITIMVFIAASIAAEGLTTEALVLKESYPQGYQVIVGHAEDKWGSDYSMVVYQINKQVKAFAQCFDKFGNPNGDTNLWVIAYYRCSIDGTASDNLDLLIAALDGNGSIGDLSTANVNWEMMIFEYEKALAARSAY